MATEVDVWADVDGDRKKVGTATPALDGARTVKIDSDFEEAELLNISFADEDDVPVPRAKSAKR